MKWKIIASTMLFMASALHAVPIRGLILVPTLEVLDEQDLEHAEGISVRGLSDTLDTQALARSLSPFVGEEITQEHLREIKQDIIDFYRLHGRRMVAVEIPEQDITEGVVAIVVLEAKIGEVVYRGNRWFSSEDFQKTIRIYTGENLQENKLSDRVAWLNRNPFHHTDIIIAPGDSIGTSDIEFLTKDRFPLSAFAGADNTGTDVTDFVRMYAGFNFGNLWGRGDLLTYQYTASPDFHQFQAHSINWITFCPWQHTLTIYGGYATIHPDITDFRSEGKNGQASLRYGIPVFPAYRAFLQEFTFGFDYKFINNNLFFVEDTGTELAAPVNQHAVNITQFMVAYQLQDRFRSEQLTFKVEVYGSPADWIANQNDSDYAKQQFGAKSRYLYGRMAFGSITELPFGFSFAGLARGQGATGTLIASEQFGLGGNDSVRGYLEREFNADNALCLNAEFRTPAMQISKSVKDEWVFLLFTDYGLGYNYDALPGTDRTQSLWSVGPGFRVMIQPYLIGRLDYGFRLKQTQFTDRFGRLHFSLNVRY